MAIYGAVNDSVAIDFRIQLRCALLAERHALSCHFIECTLEAAASILLFSFLHLA